MVPEGNYLTTVDSHLAPPPFLPPMLCNSYIFALRHGTGAQRAVTSRYLYAVGLEKERKEGECAKTPVRAT